MFVLQITTNFFNRMTNNPKRLFLLDGVGAVLTSFILGAILATFEDRIGIPKATIYSLSFVAGIFAVYSFCRYFFVGDNWRSYLKGIAIANLIYCCVTIGILIFYFHRVTILGMVYFFLEVAVVISLVSFEFRIILIAR